MKRKPAKKGSKVAFSPAKRVFSEDRSGKGLTQGKSVNDLRAKYLGGASDNTGKVEQIKKFTPKKDTKIKAVIVKRKDTGKFTDRFVQDRTVLMSGKKIIGEQG